MKKIFFSFVALIFLWGFFILNVFAQSQSWSIPKFESEITVNSDSSIKVQEKIETYFNSQKHGIYRNIPIDYKDKYGNNLNYDLS